MTPTEILTTAVAAIVILVLATSLYFWINAWNLWRAKQPIFRQYEQPHRYHHPLSAMLVLAWIFLNVLPRFANQPIAQDITLNMVQQLIVMHLLLVTVLMFLSLFVKFPHVMSFDQIGIRSENMTQQSFDGVRGFFLALIPVSLALLVTFQLRSEESTHAVLKGLIDNPDPLLAASLIVMAVITAPLAEEFMFRVVLQNWVIRVAGVWPGIVITAIVFAGIHEFPDSLPLIPLALLLGIVYERRRSFLTVFLIHALFNGFNVLLAIASSLAAENPPQ